MRLLFKKTKNFQKGLSLINFLVYIAVLSFIALALSSFVYWMISSTQKAKTARETINNAHRTTRFMIQEIKRAKSIYTPTTNLNQLSLETPYNSPSGEDTTYIDFYLCGDYVCFKKEGEPPIVLTSDQLTVTKLEFYQGGGVNGPPWIQVVLDIDHKNPHDWMRQAMSVNLNSTISMRNY